MKRILFQLACLLVLPSISQLAAQGSAAPAPKKGIFALIDKVAGQGNSKGKVPPPPPALRPSGHQHAQRVFQSSYGRSYVLTNFRDLSAEQRATHETALNTKNGFKTYRFGMSLDAFAAEAKKQGERFKRAMGEMLPGKDFLCTTPVDRQEIGGVLVEVTYGFYKASLARVLVKPHPSHSDLTAKELLAVYEAFASAYGPGEEKVVVAKDWKPTPFDGCDELVSEDALYKAMSTMLTEQRSRGGFKPEQIGENLTFCGYWWSSEQVEINFVTPNDLTGLTNTKSGVWEQGAGEKTFCLSITSKTVLGPYLAEKLASKPSSGANGI